MFSRVPEFCQRKLTRAKKHFLGGMGMAEVEIEFKKTNSYLVAFNVTDSICHFEKYISLCLEKFVLRSLC